MSRAPFKRHKKERLEILRSFIDLMGKKDSSDELKAKMITDIKDNYDKLITSMTYPTFIEKTLPIFIRILTDGDPCFTRPTNHQTVRHGILILIDRLPRNEILKPQVPLIIDAMMDIVRRDNEDNALIALRVIRNLYTRLTPKFDLEVFRLMDMIRVLLSQIPSFYPQMLVAVEDLHTKCASANQLGQLRLQTHFVSCHLSFKDLTEVTILPLSQQSLRVIQEMPRLALQLSQHYGTHLCARIAELVPYLVDVVTMTYTRQKPTTMNLQALREMIRLQARSLAFLGAVLPTHLDTVAEFHHTLMSAAVESLIDVPTQYAAERREMVGAIRLFATPLTAHWLLPVIAQLCSEPNLIGTGYTSLETLRPLAYTFLGHLMLGLVDSLDARSLAAAVQMFALALVDVTLPHRITVLSCQVLNALVAPAALNSKYDVLENILRVFAVRLKMAAKPKLPAMLIINGLEAVPPTAVLRSEEDCAERRALIGQLVIGLGTVTAAHPPCVGFEGCEATPGELKLTLSGVKWTVRGLVLFDDGVAGEAAWRAQGADILDRLVSVVCNVTLLAQSVATSITVGYIISELPANKRAIDLIGRMLQAPSIAYDAAEAVMEYVNLHVSKLGGDETNTIARLLFDKICSCVTVESGNAVATRLLEFVQKVVCLMYETKDPLPFVSALNSVFRALEDRDVPQIWPVVTELLTCLVDACHLPLKKQHRKIMVETALRVPVMLTNILPLLPLIMDASLMAMNLTDQETIMQGLVALDLLVNRVDRNFLLKEIRRYLGRVSSALGRLARSEQPAARTAAMRLIGAIGTAAADATQPLEYREMEEPVTIQTTFLGYAGVLHLPVTEVIEAAVDMLQDCSTDTLTQNHCWEVVCTFVFASIQLEGDKMALHRLFTDPSFSDPKAEIAQIAQPLYKMPNQSVRNVHVRALSGVFLAGSREEIRSRALKMIIFLSSYYAMIGVAHLTGPCALPDQAMPGRGVDALVYVDAIVAVLSLGESDLVKPALLALMFVIKSATLIVGSRERARHLPLLEYTRQRVTAMCFDRPAHRGALLAVKCMADHMDVRWSCANVADLTRCLMHVVRHSSCRIAFGVPDRAGSVMEKLVALVTDKPATAAADLAALKAAQACGVRELARELALHVIDTDPAVRYRAIHLLNELSSRSNQPLFDLLEPHKSILSERVLPKRGMLHQFSTDDKIASLEATTFCLTTTPHLYTIDPNLEAHKDFLDEVFFLCRSEEAAIASEREKYAIYEEAWGSANRWGVDGWIRVRQAAVRLLASLHFIDDCRQKIVLTLLELVKCSRPEIQDVGYEGLVRFCAGCDFATIRDLVAVELMTSLDYLFNIKCNAEPDTHDKTAARQTGANGGKTGAGRGFAEREEAASDAAYLRAKSEPSTCMLRSTWLLVRLFPETSAVLTRQLARQILENQLVPSNFVMSPSEFASRRRYAVNAAAVAPNLTSDDVEMWLYLYSHSVRARQPEFQAGPSFLREMIVAMTIANPAAAANYLLTDYALLDEALVALLLHVLRRDDGQPLRERIRDHSSLRLLALLGDADSCQEHDAREIRYQTIRVVHLLAKRDTAWLKVTSPTLGKLRALWADDAFHKQHSEGGSTPPQHWNCPRLVGQLLLQHSMHEPADLALVFELARGVCSRYFADLTFLTDWFDWSIPVRSLSQRRALFFGFSEGMSTDLRSTRHQAAILSRLVTPSLREALLESTEVIGAQSWNAEVVDSTNIVSVFAHHILSLPITVDNFLRAELLKLAVLLVTRAAPHVHNATVVSVKPGLGAALHAPTADILHKLVTYGWQGQSELNATDPMVRHLGHHLFATVVGKLPLRHRILQKGTLTKAMQGLLRADSVEVRSLVLQSLELALPLMGRLPNGHDLLHGWITDIAQDCDEAGPQMTLLLQVIVRCHWVFYNLLPTEMVDLLSRQVPLMGTRSATSQQRKLAVDIIDVLIQWAERRNAPTGSKPPGPDLAYAGPSEPGTGEAANAGEKVDHFKPAFFLNQLLRIGALSSEGPDREALRQSTERCILLIDKVFAAKLATDTGVAKVDWLYSVLIDTRSTQCQTTVLKLLACVGRHASLAQACQLAQRLHDSSIEYAEPKVLSLLHNLAVTLHLLIPGDGGLEVVGENDWEPVETFINKLISVGLSTSHLKEGGSTTPLGVTTATLESLASVRPALLDRLCDKLCCTVGELGRLEGDPTFTRGAAVSESLVKLLALTNVRSAAAGGSYRRQFVCALFDVVSRTRHSNVVDAVVVLVSECLTKTAAPSDPDFLQMYNLMSQITHNISTRFAQDFELTERFLQLVHFVYKDKSLRPMAHGGKMLESAIALGLVSASPETRGKFVMLVDSTAKKRIDKRLMHAVTSPLWRSVKHWTPFAIELIFEVITNSNAMHNTPIQQMISVSNPEHKLLGPNSIAALAKLQLADFSLPALDAKECPALLKELQSVAQMLESAHDMRSAHLFNAAAQLCHVRPALARDLWRGIFPRLWRTLSSEQQAQISCLSTLMMETLAPDHAVVVPTGDSIMLETLVICDPRPDIHWGLMQYAGKYHNLWHCMALAMEDAAVDWKPSNEAGNEQHIEEGLIRMYASMSEKDVMCAVQRNRATSGGAKEALALWQLGDFEEALETAHRVVDEIRSAPAPEVHVDTLDALSQLWTDCTKELGRWEALLEVTDMTAAQDVHLVAECAWRLQDYYELAGLVPQLEGEGFRQTDWKVHLYQGYLGLLTGPYDYDSVAEYVRLAREASILDWMRLPPKYSTMHTPALQQAQLILELEEANDLTASLQRLSWRGSHVASRFRLSVWRWESRAGSAVDGMAHLGAVAALRQAVYAAVQRFGAERRPYDKELVGVAVSSYENSAVALGRAARKRGMPRLCVELLTPETVDDESDDGKGDGNTGIGWQRMRQVLKAACQMPTTVTEGTALDPLTLFKALDLTAMPPSSQAAALALHARALRLRGQAADADTALNRAVGGGGGSGAWRRWAERLEQGAAWDAQRARHIMRCWLAAERESGTGSRRILARVMWLVQCCDDAKGSLAAEVEEAHTVRMSHWLPWIPQLLQVFAESGGHTFFQLLLKLGGRYPQAVYFALRTLYVTHKAIQEHARMSNVQAASSGENKKRANLLFLSSKLLASILRQHPSAVSPLELLSSELILLRDSWAESCVRDLRHIRLRCRTEMHAKLDDVAGATASRALCGFINARIIKRGFKDTLQHRKHNSWMQAAKIRLVEDFEKVFTPEKGVKLSQLPATVDRWLSILVPRCDNSEPTVITDRCRYISTFNRFTSVMGMFDEDFSIDVPSNRRVLVHSFLPLVEKSVGRRWLRLRGSDGVVRTFQLVTDADTAELRRRDAVLQALELINEDLDKDRETSRRQLRFAFPRVTSISHDMQLVAATPATVSLLQVYELTGGKFADQCVNEFYQQVAKLQTSTPRALPDGAMRLSFYSHVKARWANVTLREWAREAYPDPAHFWAFRKTLTSSLALALTAEYAMHLSRVDADAVMIDRETGKLYANTLTFDLRQLNNTALQSRAVAFRLTDSLAGMLTAPHIDGLLTAGMAAIGRCLSSPDAAMPALLRTVLIAQVPANVKADEAELRRRTTDWSAAIVARMAAMAQGGGEGSVGSLIEAARNPDNLCQMDPNWLPWL